MILGGLSIEIGGLESDNQQNGPGGLENENHGLEFDMALCGLSFEIGGLGTDNQHNGLSGLENDTKLDGLEFDGLTKYRKVLVVEYDENLRGLEFESDGLESDIFFGGLDFEIGDLETENQSNGLGGLENHMKLCIWPRIRE